LSHMCYGEIVLLAFFVFDLRCFLRIQLLRCSGQLHRRLSRSHLLKTRRRTCSSRFVKLLSNTTARQLCRAALHATAVAALSVVLFTSFQRLACCQARFLCFVWVWAGPSVYPTP